MMTQAIVLGTYRIKDAPTLRTIIHHSASRGINLIDTAKLYHNEQLVMQYATEAGVHFGTKIHQKMLPGATLALVHQTFMASGGTEPITRVLLHSPLPLHMWRDLEECVAKGYISEIGLCNVDLRTLQKLVQVAHVKPSMVQCEFHPFLDNLDSTLALISYCNDNGIRFEAHSLLGGKAKVIGNESVLDALSDIMGMSKRDVAIDVVKWARINAPNATLCLSSKHVDRLDDLIEAAQAADLSNVKELRGLLTPFRIYPIVGDNPLILSIAGHVLPVKLGAGETPTDEMVQRVSELVLSDKRNLLENANESDEIISGIASHLNEHKDRGNDLLFTRVALTLFNPDTLAQLDHQYIEDARTLWAASPVIASAVSKLRNLLQTMRRRMNERATQTKSKSCTLIRQSSAISHPVPMPVDIPNSSELDPFFQWLASLTTRPESDVQFGKGALLAGGHLDMCKQVVGPAHMARLCQSVAQASPGVIEHFLLGNNVAFELPGAVHGPGAELVSEQSRTEGIEMLLEIMQPSYGIKTWYLAGNCIDGEIAGKICRVLAHNDVCDSLWLKRNPLGVRGGRAIGYLLARNQKIEILDLHNTGLGDDGIVALNEELDKHFSDKSNLKHIYLGANAITPAGAPALAQILSKFSLETILLDMNNLGDEGIEILAPVLGEMASLKRLILCSNNLTHTGLGSIAKMVKKAGCVELLGVGFYKSTAVLGQSFNSFSDTAPLIDLIQTCPTLKMLRVENSILDQQECHRLQAAVRACGRVSLFAKQQRDFMGTNVMAHTNEEMARIKNPPIVDHIFSIYRNAPKLH